MGSGRLIVRGPVAAIRSCVLLLLAAVFGSGLIASSALAAGHGAPVTITRDSSGIPHIVATNFTALGYGEGYVFAQDDLCTFANDIVTLEGNRSRYFGPGGTAVNYSAGTFSTNLQSDLYWRYVKASGIIKRQLSAPPPTGLLPQVREIYTGWVAGYNRARRLPRHGRTARPGRMAVLRLVSHRHRQQLLRDCVRPVAAAEDSLGTQHDVHGHAAEVAGRCRAQP